MMDKWRLLNVASSVAILICCKSNFLMQIAINLCFPMSDSAAGDAYALKFSIFVCVICP